MIYDRGLTVLGGGCSRGTRVGAPRSVSGVAVIVGVGVPVGTRVFVAVGVGVLLGVLAMT